MKHVVIATILAIVAGSSFGKDKAGPSPACAALQSAKDAQARGEPFEQYRIVTNDGEQVVATPEQAIELWGPRCQRPQPSAAKVGTSGKAVAQKSGQTTATSGG